MSETHWLWRYLQAAPAVRQFAALAAGDPGRWIPMALVRCSRGPIAAGRLMGWFYGLSQQVSLPLAIWLSSGWVGLLAHWQAPAGLAFLLEKAAGRAEAPVPAQIACAEMSKGDA